MNLSTMAIRAIRTRGWVSLLTLASLSLGVALPCAILRIREQVEQTLLEEGGHIDLVVGAKGSPLQLVLSAVHHLDLPTGNIPCRLVKEFREDTRVTEVLPIGLGDNIQGYRIVGTDEAVRSWTLADGAPLAVLAEGEWFNEPFETVLGVEVARRVRLGIGDRFVGAHGLVAAPGTDHEEFPYTVTGVLEETGGAVDRLVFTPIASVWKVHAAEKELHNRMFASGKNAANTETEITAMWLRLRSPGLRMWMREEINEDTSAMAAAPMDEMLRLSRGVLQPLQDGLLIMAAAVVGVSGLAILSTLLQAAERRRRDWALLRILGAHPREIFLLVWMEALWLSLAGVILGVLISHGGLAFAAAFSGLPVLQGLDFWRPAAGEGAVLLSVGLFGALAGILPAASAYRRSPLREMR
jgi:putative ABC transport system permease protein